jgi:uncharacterized integral membrane protein
MSSEAAEPSSTPPESSKPKPDATTSTPAPELGVKFTRAGALWAALFVGFLILILLLVFILQNTDSAEFAFLGWRWSLPLGVAILLAAVGGGLVTVAAGTARIFQLRRAVKKNLKLR